MPQGFKQFVAKQDTDSLFTSLRKETIEAFAPPQFSRIRVRDSFCDGQDAHVEGYASKLLTGDVSPADNFSISRLEDAGLVEREVQLAAARQGTRYFVCLLLTLWR